jgi:hypothetical protein
LVFQPEQLLFFSNLTCPLKYAYALGPFWASFSVLYFDGIEENCIEFPLHTVKFTSKTLHVVLEYLSDPRYSDQATTTNAKAVTLAFAPQLFYG